MFALPYFRSDLQLGQFSLILSQHAQKLVRHRVYRGGGRGLGRYGLLSCLFMGTPSTFSQHLVFTCSTSQVSLGRSLVVLSWVTVPTTMHMDIHQNSRSPFPSSPPFLFRKWICPLLSVLQLLSILCPKFEVAFSNWIWQEIPLIQMSKSTHVVTHSVTVVDAIFRVQFLLFFSLLLNIAIFSHNLSWLWFLLPLVLPLFSHLPSHLDPLTFSLTRKQKDF